MSEEQCFCHLKIDEVDYEVKDAVARNKIGDLTQLDTTDKTTLVDAINEVKNEELITSSECIELFPSDVNNVKVPNNLLINKLVGSPTSSSDDSNIKAINLNTSAKTLVTAINEVNTTKLIECNNVSAMSTLNLAVGNSVRTLGYYTANDGGGATYLIREKTESDSNLPSTLFLTGTGQSNLVAELIIDERFNTKQFGLLGNGTTDEGVKLQAFLDTDTNIFTFKEGNYLIDRDIAINSNSHIIFEPGAKITRKDTANSNYFMFNIANKTSITIDNAHLVGDKDTHLDTEGDWGYGIHIYGSQYVTLNNCIIEETWGDGIYIGYSYSVVSPLICKHISVNDCKVLNCSRNGYSICSGEDIVIKDCYSYGVTRTNPKAGMDIEPEAPNGTTPYLKNILVENFRSDSNGYGISLTNNFIIENLTINNHTSVNEDSAFVVYKLDNDSNVVYKNANISKCNSSGIQITKSVDSTLIIKNIIIDSTRKSNQTHNFNAAIVIFTDSSTNGNLVIDNVEHIKTFSTLYEFDDLICERGSGTFTGLTLKNINTTKYLCINNVNYSSVNLINASFISKSGYYLIDNDNHNMFNLIDISTLESMTTRNITTNIPDGDYEIKLGTSSGYGLSVAFNSAYTIYNATGSTKTFYASQGGAYMKFTKSGTNIFIRTNSGFTN